MRIILIRKPFFIAFSIALITGCIFSAVLSYRGFPVYRDRVYWEKTGDIVWEVNLEKKLICLTFDDGPSPTFTGQILSLLDKYNTKATFFVTGKQAERYPEIVRMIHEKAHEIGNHTYHHREIFKMSRTELENDLRQAHQAIKKIIRSDVKLFRPTSGFYNDTVARAAKSLNYKTIIWTWSQDSRDWSRINGRRIAQNVIRAARPGQIILFHDQGGDRKNTVDALQIILPALTSMGYRFVTVSELLKHSKNNNTAPLPAAFD